MEKIRLAIEPYAIYTTSECAVDACCLHKHAAVAYVTTLEFQNISFHLSLSQQCFHSCVITLYDEFVQEASNESSRVHK